MAETGVGLAEHIFSVGERKQQEVM